MQKDFGKQVKDTSLNKYALVSGASGGLGREYVNELVDHGYSLILLGRNIDKLDYFSRSLILKDTQTVKIIQCDITIDEDVKRVFSYIIDNDIKLDLVINNAGLDFEGWFRDISHEDITSIAKINVVGTLNIIHRCLDCKAEELTIINISSLAGFFPMPMKAVYSASKRFLIDLTRTLNYELKEDNVHLTVVCPAGMPTRDDILEKIKSQGLIGRLTTINYNKVVKKTMIMAKKRKTVYIPGIVNIIMVKFSSLMPRKLLVKRIGDRWRKSSNNT